MNENTKQIIFRFLEKYIHRKEVLVPMSEEFARLLADYRVEEISQALDDFDRTRGQYERVEVAAIVRRIEDSRERNKTTVRAIPEMDNGYSKFLLLELKKWGYEKLISFMTSDDRSMSEKISILNDIEKEFEAQIQKAI